MSRKCVITNKSTKMAGGYSNRTRATQFNPTGMVRKKANLQKRKIFVPEIGKYVSVNISTKGLRTLTKKGAYKALKDAKAI
jgi:large subunit ribosomal protein L28